MSALDMIYNNPLLYAMYRIGILKQRIETLKTESELYVISNAMEMNGYEEELSAWKHMADILSDVKKTVA